MAAWSRRTFCHCSKETVIGADKVMATLILVISTSSLKYAGLLNDSRAMAIYDYVLVGSANKTKNLNVDGDGGHCYGLSFRPPA